ncbi:CRISPR-associated endonuclease Cas2 [Pasteurellaceae bacterium TAE3-ERU1]|nr:CRISPR-associated endonuclease Cas2 [Pasteurellaceae bacterium TAE3-ERU1]
MQRNHYLVAYDICEAKRLQRVHKAVEAYAVGGQKSFYDCWMTKTELLALKQRLTELMECDCDRAYFFQLHPMCKQYFYGVAKTQSVEPFLFI